MKKARVVFQQVFLFFFLSCCIFSFASDREMAFFQKTDARLLAQFSGSAPVDFWVMMNEQADVSDAYKLATKEEKGQFVFDKLTEFSSRTQNALLPLLNSRAVSYKQFWIVNAIFVTGDIELAKDLAAYSEVKLLVQNAKYKMEEPIIEPAGKDATLLAIEWGITKVNADKVWALGYKGQGAVIGGQDTGVEFDHLAIETQYRGYTGSVANHNYNWHDAIHSGSGGSCGINSIAPCDDHNHGTHTIGTIVGDDGAGNQIGMAPQAKWIAARNMDVGVGTLTTYTECFQWFLAPTDLNDQNPTPSKAPHVINNSWGCDAGEGCNTSNFNVIKTAIANLRAAGIMVVASAGNDGSSCSTVKNPPALFDESFSVGSTTSADAMSSFSSRGPVTADGSNRPKPDISAPGSSVRSCIRSGNYATYSGTSMAGPHVVGLVALLISAKPSLAGQVDTIESIIQKTAVHITTTQTCGGTSPSTWPNNTVGHGRINALAAINLALTNPTGVPSIPLTGSVSSYPNPVSSSINIRLINISEGGKVRIYSIEGQLLMEQEVSPSENLVRINASKLAKGFYLYSFEGAKQSCFGRFMKN